MRYKYEDNDNVFEESVSEANSVKMVRVKPMFIISFRKNKKYCMVNDKRIT